jgi:hypothetical protein
VETETQGKDHSFASWNDGGVHIFNYPYTPYSLYNSFFSPYFILICLNRSARIIIQ